MWFVQTRHPWKHFELVPDLNGELKFRNHDSCKAKSIRQFTGFRQIGFAILFGMDLVSVWYRFGVGLVLVWNRFETGLESVWGPVGMSGIGLASVWDQFGISFDSNL